MRGRQHHPFRTTTAWERDAPATLSFSVNYSTGRNAYVTFPFNIEPTSVFIRGQDVALRPARRLDPVSAEHLAPKHGKRRFSFYFRCPKEFEFSIRSKQLQARRETSAIASSAAFASRFQLIIAETTSGRSLRRIIPISLITPPTLPLL